MKIVIDEELGILSKHECVSPNFIIQKRKTSICSFAWDPNFASDVIEIANNRSLFLREEAYVFRSVIADKSFTEGIHYWEIIADARTENELKVGVCKNKDFDLKTAFCDYSFGWAYYGNGQLRHCDGANG
jgi:E3 ubiquitin-protein ligase NRDP1